MNILHQFTTCLNSALNSTQVPSNYDPEKRTYSGIWDGSLKPAYSNNPAWCLWDMLTHPRYGMGKRAASCRAWHSTSPEYG
nr:hypothetical protein [Escherichia coli]